ncbi:hypothetical protein SAMN05444267_100478 [Chryseobacterium polytrichastri]|uniref:Uncharacterized protein n=1 Tax=Chryseobacterium polytrichastri TaxID=1302687 RepID=A0A1M6SNT2_9FLAO|nr:hypothetical protein SAMN05444267_100478 [Chryseobacterium polytrichastri]
MVKFDFIDYYLNNSLCVEFLINILELLCVYSNYDGLFKVFENNIKLI